MKVIYFTVDEDNRLSGGYSSSSSFVDDEIRLELPDNHELFTDDSFHFSYIDGELVKDDVFALKESKEAYFNKLSAECKADILGYFDYTLNGVAYKFSFDFEAQMNFYNTLTFFNSNMINSVEWTAHRNGESERIIIKKNEFIDLCMTAFNVKDSKVKKLRNIKGKQINSAKSMDELKKITWIED